MNQVETIGGIILECRLMGNKNKTTFFNKRLHFLNYFSNLCQPKVENKMKKNKKISQQSIEQTLLVLKDIVNNYNVLQQNGIIGLVSDDEKIICDECEYSSTDERRFTYSKKTLCYTCN